MGVELSGQDAIDFIDAMKSAGIPGIVAVAIIWASLFRKRDTSDHDGISSERFDSFRREAIDFFTRIETKIDLMRDRK